MTDIEKQLLQAYVQSESSLFSVEIVDQSQFSISLRDLFHENRQVMLTSQSPIVAKCLIFCRILNINGIQMTSGASFVFYNKDQEKLLKEYKAQLKKALAATAQAKSFIAFAKTSRRFGVSTNYQNVDEENHATHKETK